jgi:hypothetical protein
MIVMRVVIFVVMIVRHGRYLGPIAAKVKAGA